MSPSRIVLPLNGLVLAACLLGLSADCPAQQATGEAVRLQWAAVPGGSTGEVALTFDDLPAHGPLPPGLSRVDIAKEIIHTLQGANAPPTYGFVNAKLLDQEPASVPVLQLWRDAGFLLGNHTFSHMDLQINTVAAFENDIQVNEPTLRAVMGDQDWHWLRFPFLREGDTPEKHKAIAAFLKEHGYRVAEVTLSFGDYNYNEPYARCLVRNDLESIEWLKQTYLTSAAQELSRGQTESRELFGRDIKHVMLLHIGGFETVMLPRLLELLKQRGFKLITLEEADGDPVYAIDPDLASNWGGTFLQQMMRAKHISSIEVASHIDRLNALCR